MVSALEKYKVNQSELTEFVESFLCFSEFWIEKFWAEPGTAGGKIVNKLLKIVKVVETSVQSDRFFTKMKMFTSNVPQGDPFVQCCGSRPFFTGSGFSDSVSKNV